MKHIKKKLQFWYLALLVLTILGFLFSVILSLQHFKNGLMIGCAGGSECNQVLNSSWSMLFGIMPVSGLAVGIYSSMFVAVLFTRSETETSIKKLVWNVLLVMAGAITGSAIWFFILQKWVIGSFCVYCMSTHLIGLVIVTIIVWKGSRELKSFSSNVRNHFHVLGRIIVGLVFAGVMVIIQIVFTPTAVYEDGNSRTVIRIVDYKTSPIIGSPNAKNIVTVLFDYQCPHCQKLHLMLNEIVKRYGNKVAFVICPTPLNSSCNYYITRDVDAFKNSCELAKVGLAVWRSNQKEFPVFESWMFSFESGDKWKPRNLEEVKNKAIKLVGKEEFEKAMADPWITQYIESCIRIYGQTFQNGNGAIPKLIFNSRWVVPEPRDVDNLVLILQKSLGISIL